MNAERYELIRVEADQCRRLAYSPDCEGIGLALRVLREEGQISATDQLGIRDAQARTWVLNPYARAV